MFSFSLDASVPWNAGSAHSSEQRRLNLTESASYCVSCSQAFPGRWRWCLKHVIGVIMAVRCQSVAKKVGKCSHKLVLFI